MLPALGRSAPIDALVRVHDHLIGRILAEEEELIARHRAHIDRMVELMKDEMGHVNNVDRPGSTVARGDCRVTVFNRSVTHHGIGCLRRKTTY